MPIYEAADKALKTFQEEFMPVETFSEFLDAAGQCRFLFCLVWFGLVWFCFVLFCFVLFCFVFRDRVSLYSPGCPGTHSVDQAGLELRNPPDSASRVLGLKACAWPVQFSLVEILWSKAQVCLSELAIIFIFTEQK
jgi:hypothetical protein